MFRALRSRNYRLFFGGQAISLIGTWLTKVAMAWLVYELVKGPGEATPAIRAKAAALLGVVTFVANVPMFFFAPFGGVIVDRFSRQKVLVFTQFMAMVQSGTLAVLTLGGWITIPQVIVLALLQGLIDALDTPARQAFTVELVDDPVDLSNAIALNSSCFNAARLLGPAIGGLMLLKLSAGWCFAIDSASYIAVIAGLVMIRLTYRPRTRAGKNVIADLNDGFHYTFGFTPLRAILVLVGVSSFTGTVFSTLMPLFADAMTNGPDSGATRFGLLMGGTGAGAFLGAIYLASRRTVVGLGRVMCLAAILLAMSISAFSLTHNFYLGMALCMTAGFGMVTHFASGNTLLQTITEDAMRGRVMSFFSMSVIGMAPFGSLLAGFLSARLGPTPVVLTYAAFMFVSALLFLHKLPQLRQLVRPIYVKKGIIPEVAVALAMEEREER